MQAYSPKKLLQRCFPVSFSNISMLEKLTGKHLWRSFCETRLGGDWFSKYHSFSFLRQPHQPNVTLDLGYVPSIYFQSKCESHMNNYLWKSYTISTFIADKTSHRSKTFLEIRSSRPAYFLKIYFHKFHKKASVMKSLFRKAVCSYTSNCT